MKKSENWLNSFLTLHFCEFESNFFVLYCILLYCILLYCIVLYCIVLYRILLNCIFFHLLRFSCHMFHFCLFLSTEIFIISSSIFPLLCLQCFTTEEEAVQIANDSTYGLAAAVFSSNPALCDRVVRKMRAGVVWQNCSQVLCFFSFFN